MDRKWIIGLGALGALFLFTKGPTLYQQGHLSNASVHVGNKRFWVRVANDNKSRARGLMGVRTLKPGTGMLFTFDKPERHTFWMKNTHIPLHLAFFRRNGTLDSIHHMRPHDLRGASSRGPVLYALEVNLGELDNIGSNPRLSLR